ncbi:hypothetical protein CCZ01_00140 [Helicobacter monodelphidis]|uniref:uracil-DNA glycosylase family protein n=1 Tax=Helicobacter sp. 15-1451 TaxID=2004995 RepID=UPI000DCE2D74|nr:uracil-DNA glycosylase family protein [Helicobacter sp. 15-1451]RAX59193.1 hypothetical protein CCZ01_00140 [Helicobacter sp. 15-1451]
MNAEKILELRRLYWERMCGMLYLEPKVIQHKAIYRPTNQNLVQVERDIQHCQLCLLGKSQKQNVGFYGQNLKVAFVSETPFTPHSHSSSLITRSGEMLHNMIENVLLLKRDEIALLSVLKCTPNLGDTNLQEPTECCRPYLYQQLMLLSPHVIVLLGDNVGQFFFMEDMQNMRGKKQIWEGMNVVLTYSPKFLLKNPSFKKDAMRDLLFIKNLL